MKNLAFVQSSSAADWEKEFLLRVKDELSQADELSQSIPGANFQIVDRIDQADLVLYSDTISRKSTRKELSDCRELLEEVQAQGGLLFALNFEDCPLGVLPGIYTSLQPQNFDSTLHLSWPHLEAPNRAVEIASMKCPSQAQLLFTFAGSCSHRLRKKLFSLYGSSSEKSWKVVEIDRWYNHTKGEHQQYVQDIMNSSFVLCPRGIAAYSHRIFESILLERVPVIIADDWVPFSFPEQDYYIRIPEREIGQIVPILEREFKNYDVYHSNLLKVKSNWFTSRSRYQKVVEHFLQFQQQYRAAHDPAKLVERLKSVEFHKSNGLLSYQRFFKTATRILSQLPKKKPGSMEPGNHEDSIQAT